MIGFYLIIAGLWLIAVTCVAILVVLFLMLRRSARLGDKLLEACAGDYETALLAIKNTRADTDLACNLLARPRRNWFMRDFK